MKVDHSTLGLIDEEVELPEGERSPAAEETAEASAEEVESTPETDAEAADQPTEESEPEAQAETAESEGQEQEKEPSAEDAEGAQSEPFEWAGEKYESREAAEQESRTWKGRLQAEQERSSEKDTRLNEYWEYVQAVSRENDELRQRLESTEKTPTQSAEKAEKEGEAPTEIDWDRLQKVRSAAEKLGMDPFQTTIRDYHQQMEKLYERKLDERLSAVEKPIEDMQNSQVEDTANRQVFLWAQSARNDQGAPMYPELQADNLDTDLVTRMFKVWQRMGQEYGAKYAYSAPGVDYAYRLARDSMPAPQQAAPAKTSGPERDASGRFVSQRGDARAASQISGNQPNPTQRQKKSRTQEALEELTAHQPIQVGETSLGFFE